MKTIIVIVLVVLLAVPVMAQEPKPDEMKAIEHLRKELNSTRQAAGAGILVLGAAVAIYGLLQYQDAKDAPDELDVDTTRHLILAGGGAFGVILGLVAGTSGDKGKGGLMPERPKK